MNFSEIVKLSKNVKNVKMAETIVESPGVESIDIQPVEDDDSFTIGAKTSTSLWIYLYRCAKLGSRSLWHKKKNVVLEEEIRSLCDKVISNYMSRKQPDFTGTKRHKTNVPIRDDVLQCFYNMTDLIVASNPNLYSDVALKLNITLQEERVVCKAYSDFAECLFSKGITWPLIISFLAFSGALAVECARNGRSILVKSISDWATIFIVMRLKEWIVENGKWDGVLTYFEPKKQANSVISEAFLNEMLSKYSLLKNPIQWTSFLFVLVISLYVLFSISRNFEFLSGKTDLVEDGIGIFNDNSTMSPLS